MHRLMTIEEEAAITNAVSDVPDDIRDENFHDEARYRGFVYSMKCTCGVDPHEPRCGWYTEIK